MKKAILFIKALSVFLGTVIGVGIFSLPFVALKAGFFVTVFYFLLMGSIAILIHLLYGEVVLGTKEIYRLPGYVGKYLGLGWKKVTFFIISLGLTGALLAYLIVGGEFLNFFFSSYFGGNSILYTLLFFVFGAYLIFRGTKSISQIEFSLLVVFFAILALFFIKVLPFINVEYFKTFNFEFFTLPYGVILFALWGSALVPEIKEILAGDKKSLRRTIFWGIVIAALTYLIFIFIILGASGPATSKEAISGLAQTLGDNVIRLGFIFGVICCFTSFITLGLTLKKVLWYDFGLKENLAWALTCFLPLILFFLGFREFIEIIGFTGALMIGAEGIIIVFLYREFLKKKLSRKMSLVLYLLPGFFILGIIFEILHFLLKYQFLLPKSV
ncbi:aromatic amino acid transport family protein [Patescibacteria group bacterium]